MLLHVSLIKRKAVYTHTDKSVFTQVDFPYKPAIEMPLCEFHMCCWALSSFSGQWPCISWLSSVASWWVSGLNVGLKLLGRGCIATGLDTRFCWFAVKRCCEQWMEIVFTVWIIFAVTWFFWLFLLLWKQDRLQLTLPLLMYIYKYQTFQIVWKLVIVLRN